MANQIMEFALSYTTPAIEKIPSDFILQPVTIDAHWRSWCGDEKYGIYFVQSGEGYIKIGKSNDIHRRVGNYRTHNPMMRLVGVISPALAYLDYNENLLHRLWEPFIVSLEWFAPVRPLIEYLRSFDKYGFGHPMELIDPEPASWSELLMYQKRIEEVRGAR